MADNTSKYSRYRRTDRQINNHMGYNNNNEYQPHTKIDSSNMHNICSRNAYQRATINVPIAIKPFSFVGPANTICCHDPIIADMHCTPHGHKQICCFVVSQEICVEIPVHFGAQACAGEAWVDCHGASTESCRDGDTEQQS